MLQTPDYLGPSNNCSIEGARIMERTSFVGRSIYRNVLYKGYFQPAIGTTLIMVRLLIPSVNAKELENWYEKVSFTVFYRNELDYQNHKFQGAHRHAGGSAWLVEESFI